MRPTPPRLLSTSRRLLNQARALNLPHLPPLNYHWLRDACPCPQCVDPGTRHKMFESSSIPDTISPVQNGVRVLDNSTLNVQWEGGHKSEYSFDYLRRWAGEGGTELKAWRKDVLPKSWAASDLSGDKSLFVNYSALDDKEGIRQAREQLLSRGIVLIKGVPNEETDDANCELRTLARKFGEIRNTFYGEVWNVRAEKRTKNVAYTSLHLGLHMDLLYFADPPRYQILHCLRNRVKGGQSVFVDAFHAANQLTAQEQSVLASTPVRFHYVNGGHHLHHSHPTLEFGRPFGDTTRGEQITSISYSPPFQAPLPANVPEAFVPALRRFADLLAKPEATWRYLLQEGDAVIFDNRRVLHARDQFDENGERWLKGCYLGADEVWERTRVGNGAALDL